LSLKVHSISQPIDLFAQPIDLFAQPIDLFAQPIDLLASGVHFFGGTAGFHKFQIVLRQSLLGGYDAVFRVEVSV
jgi:hypothetical protein